MFSPRRRPRREPPQVTVQVSQPVADALATLSERDILRLKAQGTLLHRVLMILEVSLVVFVFAVAVYVWGPWWEWQEILYNQTLQNCKAGLSETATKTNLGVLVGETQANDTCLWLTQSLKAPPASRPWNRLLQVKTWMIDPAGEWLISIFVEQENKETKIRLSSLDDYASEVDPLGNPSIKAVVAEAIRLQPGYDVPWRVVVDACYYESGGLHQYASEGVLVQGKNLNSDGSLSSTDWGLCQINDYWHPNLMKEAKADWRGNLKASFEVMNGTWALAKDLSGEYQMRYAWAKYNGSGPYDTYANRVLADHNLIDSQVKQIVDQLSSPQPQSQKVYLASGKIISPGGCSDLAWGFDRQYNGLFGVWGKHDAQDFNACGGLAPFPVVAALNGKITRYELHNAGCGGVIDITSDDGHFRAQYCHMDNTTMTLSLNSRVEAGFSLGIADGSGNLSGGPHLHFHLWKDGISVDPLLYISR